ncbi:uncharacterized protein LOC113201825 [Frankliniella occidentalis]|uniref:Uncharacterized protein LOC113201825 n=1 Tax=Frankliniella occidentalis TaxID=133901 RepID=A0A6J1RR14_FRAOC|nr:uncharacterized protein LOC113201825 [Frankliniella occidentalis]
MTSYWALLLLGCAVQLALAARRGPPHIMGHNEVYTKASIEAAGQLNSGAIFVKEGDFFLSVSEWVLLLPMKRVDGYVAHLLGLENNLKALLQLASASEQIKHEVTGILVESAGIKKEIENFQLSVPVASTTTTTTTTPSSIPAQPAAGRRRRRSASPQHPLSAFSPSDRRGMPASPHPGSTIVGVDNVVAQGCSPDGPVQVCPLNVLQAPVFAPSSASHINLQIIRWLKVFYRRAERMMMADLQNGTRFYQPYELFPAPPRKGAQGISPNLPYMADTPVDAPTGSLYGTPTPTSSSIFVDPYDESPKPVEGDKPPPLFVDPYTRRRKRYIPSVIYYSPEPQVVANMDPDFDFEEEAPPPPSRPSPRRPAPTPSVPSSTSPSGSPNAVRPALGSASRGWDSVPTLESSGTRFNTIDSHIIPDLSQPSSWRQASRPIGHWDGMLQPLGAEFYVGQAAGDGNSTRPHRRTRRGLVNAVGRLESFLFGTMSDSDRSRLDNKMAAMGNQVGLLARISDEFASKLTVTLKTMKDHDAQIKKLTELALVRFDRMSTDATLSSALRNTHAAIASIREEVLAFVGAWEVAAMDGGLSSSFIEPHRLLDILLALTEELKPLGLQLPIPPSLANIHVFYGVIIVQPLLRNDRLTLFLHVPLVQADRKFALYKSHPWPYPIPNSTHHDVFAFFKPETEYIAVNGALTTHLLMTEADVAKCRASEIRVCHPTVALHQGTDTCSKG